MKKIISAILILFILLASYIGIHRVIYSSEYAKVKTLTEDIFKTKNELADIQSKVDRNKVELDKAKNGNPLLDKYGSNNLNNEYEKSKQELINAKSKYEKQQAELSYLKDKTNILKFLK